MRNNDNKSSQTGANSNQSNSAQNKSNGNNTEITQLNALLNTDNPQSLIGKKVNIERTEEALSLNPEVISTACPFCMTMLTDGVKEKGMADEVKVKDFAELVFEVSK